MRSELTPAQRTSHVARRRRVWEAMHRTPAPVPAWERDEEKSEVEPVIPPQSVAPSFEGQLGGARPQKKDFAASTAELTGESKQHINRQLAVAEALGEDLQKVEAPAWTRALSFRRWRSCRKNSVMNLSSGPPLARL